MHRKYHKIPKSFLNLPALAGIIICLGLYGLQFIPYYKDGADIRHVLLSLQFPFMQAIPYKNDTILPDTPPVPAKSDMDEVKIELLPGELTRPPADDKAPKVLIYHTHATEAYFKCKGYSYKDNGEWRTLENDKNMVAVGERLAECLREKGIAVLHDTTNHEPPKLATAYYRSVVTMEKYRDKYPSITTYIDVHRDSYGNDPKENADYITIDGKEYAKMMFVVGKGVGATGTGYDEMPDFEANYALAKKITDIILTKDSRLMRDIRVKKGRYNQHISNRCLLVEVGHNANTLDQALNSVELLADAIAEAAFADDQLTLSP